MALKINMVRAPLVGWLVFRLVMEGVCAWMLICCLSYLFLHAWSVDFSFVVVVAVIDVLFVCLIVVVVAVIFVIYVLFVFVFETITTT